MNATMQQIHQDDVANCIVELSKNILIDSMKMSSTMIIGFQVKLHSGEECVTHRVVKKEVQTVGFKSYGQQRAINFDKSGFARLDDIDGVGVILVHISHPKVVETFKIEEMALDRFVC